MLTMLALCGALAGCGEAPSSNGSVRVHSALNAISERIARTNARLSLMLLSPSYPQLAKELLRAAARFGSISTEIEEDTWPHDISTRMIELRSALDVSQADLLGFVDIGVQQTERLNLDLLEVFLQLNAVRQQLGLRLISERCFYEPGTPKQCGGAYLLSSS